MQAFGFKQHGSIESMTLFETDIPRIKPSQLLIKVHASALNRLDLWVCKGWPGLDLILPHISGSDAAGEVIELGEQISNFTIGDRVAINPGVNLYADEFTANGENSVSPGYKILGEQLPGTHTQYIAVEANNCVKLPEHIDYASAAAIGLVGLTTWRMLIKKAQMQLGQNVLVMGAAGGVNSFSIILAKMSGCNVATITSTEEKMQQAYEIGADHVFNYHDDPEWARKLWHVSGQKGFDIVVDNVGKATIPQSLKLVKRGGKIVIVGNTTGPEVNIDLRYLFSKQISLIGSTMGNQADYQNVMNLLFNDKIKPLISNRYSLANAHNAVQDLAVGNTFGKLILEP